MKELSIEEKAKAYDEVRKKIAIRFGSNVADEIFSQFEMSEDERIRKAIIEHCKCSLQCTKTKETVKTISEWIDWLEKQGEQKSNTDFSDLRTWKYIVDAVWTEKEGIGQYLDSPFTEEVAKKLQKRFGNIEQKPAEKQGEQKTEPKFQNGQWIVWQNKCYKVNDNGCGYELIDQNGLSTSLEYGTIDESARLWDITKDAKDGDILANDNHILILRKLAYSWAADENPDSLYAYCGIKPNGNFELEQKGYCFCGPLYAHPATKEQRDTLERAMADAGYTFDFDKKELKKIE